ncbi:MAG: hypothetical protein GX647_04975 [Clostridiales bacterium]|jgi:hypothetical protein|nr:hypothetical protein [Clostridiales bacterium]
MDKPSAEAVLRQVMSQGTPTVTLEDVAAILELEPVELRRQIVTNRGSVGFPVCVIEMCGGEVRIPRGGFLAWLLGGRVVLGEIRTVDTSVTQEKWPLGWL